MSRRFEAGDRFWEIEQDGVVVRIVFGKVGTPGNRVERSLGADYAATAYLEQEIAKQIARGYRELAPKRLEPLERRLRFEYMYEGKRRFTVAEQSTLRVATHGGLVTPNGDLPDPDESLVRIFRQRADADGDFDAICADARYRDGDIVAERAYEWHSEPALEAQCEEARDVPGPWSVYADWLIARGDLRGELAALVAAGKDEDAGDLLDTHAAALHGNDHATVALEYRHGFVVGAQITIGEGTHEDLAHAMRAFLASPLGRFVERLRTGIADVHQSNDWGPTLRAIIDSPRAPHIRSLRLDAYERLESEFERTTAGDLSHAWSQLPALEELRIRAGAESELGTLDLPRLQSFAFEHANPRKRELDVIVHAKLPALTSLELWLGSPLFLAEASVEALRPLLAGTNVPSLTELHLYNCWFSDELIAALAQSALLPRLTGLALPEGNIARRACAVLREHADAFAHLARLDLAGNYLIRSELAALAKRLPNLHAPRQHRREGDEAPAYDDLPF